MDHISNFIYELGQLRHICHEGWKLASVAMPESVAEHSLRTAQISYMLAVLEGYDNPAEVCAMAVFHDVGETRIGDLHKVAQRYVNADERQAVMDQMEPLGTLGVAILGLWEQFDNHHSRAGVIAHDADLLEMAASAREYEEIGYQMATSWLDNIAPRLQTVSAQRLIESLRTNSPNRWWQGLKKLD
jgi:putative hydrolase of HD superfamily